MSSLPVVAILIAVILLGLVLLRIDWTPGRYKVLYHPGSDVDIKTRMASG